MIVDSLSAISTPCSGVSELSPQQSHAGDQGHQGGQEDGLHGGQEDSLCGGGEARDCGKCDSGSQISTKSGSSRQDDSLAPTEYVGERELL